MNSLEYRKHKHEHKETGKWEKICGRSRPSICYVDCHHMNGMKRDKQTWRLKNITECHTAYLFCWLPVLENWRFVAPTSWALKLKNRLAFDLKRRRLAIKCHFKDNTIHHACCTAVFQQSKELKCHLKMSFSQRSSRSIKPLPKCTVNIWKP